MDSWSSREAYGRRLDFLLDDLHRQKEKQRRESLYSRRGAALAALAFLLLVAWMRSGGSKSSSSAGGTAGERLVHCYFLLDRTGSMRPLQSAVVKGFNSYVEEQRQQPGSMLLTLAQFSSEVTLDIQFEARDIHAVQPLSAFEPRGSTPLYDALSLLIEHATKATAARGGGASAAAAAEAAGSEVVVVVFTDGRENASRQRSREDLFKLIEARRRAGWTFVFLGANQDSFEASSQLAVAAGATSNFVADAKGVQAAYTDLSGGVMRARKSLRAGRPQALAEKAAFLKGFHSAEADYRQRGHQGADHAKKGAGAGGSGVGRRRKRFTT